MNGCWAVYESCRKSFDGFDSGAPYKTARMMRIVYTGQGEIRGPLAGRRSKSTCTVLTTDLADIWQGLNWLDGTIGPRLNIGKMDCGSFWKTQTVDDWKWMAMEKCRENNWIDIMEKV